MYNGYTESAEQIAARKARILDGYQASKPPEEHRQENVTDRHVKSLLDRLPFHRRLAAYHALIYLAWRDGSAGENVTAAEILKGVWEYHIQPVRHFYMRLALMIGTEGMAAALFVIAFLFWMIGGLP